MWMEEAIKTFSNVIKSQGINLEQLFAKFDADKTNSLDYDEFNEGLVTILGDKNFSTMQRQKLAAYIAKGKKVITLEDFRNAFTVTDSKVESWKNQSFQSAAVQISLHKDQLKSAFREMDPLNTGLISCDDLKLALTTLNGCIDSKLSEIQIDNLVNIASKSVVEQGKVKYKEFMRQFKVTDMQLL
eukprot:TRINITY_DN10608_c0_g1_i1.p1 TRINITY_DN10608_c0_g1~~TRINITY_DN10608_c0_g1_i1.p1  ORF type:complete len:186 (+),score=23.32 TRINITY_DN10608_c0_g1_i1:43-600(+)